ncbi:hypothetical protein FM996_11570 [Methylosinus sporium]|uniref:Uncharacterized protein n=1 Tax=Methylosinus sporium TaxID=428 RepID=A0A549STY4_METSR|nr:MULTISPECIES: hypothetical protein [Methylosinus]MBU3889060.1 hypothetical protein [Methylosinus sp. KRF6]TRL33112.1 hypothetical protein FM996_11570 [Methylosinus sporium]
MLGRDKIARAARELAEHLQIIENIKSLQEAQKQLADAIGALDQRLRLLEVELKVIRADVRVDALRETQNIVNSVQGGLNQRIEDLAIKVALMEKGASAPRIEAHPSLPLANNAPKEAD